MIFDEKSYAENMNKNGFTNGLRQKDLFIYAKWLKYIGKNFSQIKTDLNEFCKKHEPKYNEIIHANYIKRALREVKKHHLRIPIEIHITKNELEVIDNINNIKYQKALFIILLVSKYFKLNPVKILSKKNKEHKKDNNFNCYFNSNIKTAIELAKIKLTKKERIKMQRYLIENKYLENTENATLKVLFAEIDGESIININNYNNIILYYENYIGMKDAIHCIKCNKIIEKTNNKQKYCMECAEEVHRDVKRNWKRKHDGSRQIKK